MFLELHTTTQASISHNTPKETCSGKKNQHQWRQHSDICVSSHSYRSSKHRHQKSWRCTPCTGYSHRTLACWAPFHPWSDRKRSGWRRCWERRCCRSSGSFRSWRMRKRMLRGWGDRGLRPSFWWKNSGAVRVRLCEKLWGLGIYLIWWAVRLKLGVCDAESCDMNGLLLEETQAHIYTQNYSSTIPILSTSTRKIIDLMVSSNSQ